MKKKLLGLIMVICLLVVSVFPSMAAGSDDPEVDKSYNAYVAIQEAINTRNIEALRIATEEFQTANEALSDEQMEELEMLIGGEVYGVIITAYMILGTADAYENFLKYETIHDALKFVKAYEVTVINGGIKINTMNEFVKDINNTYHTDIDTAYHEALFVIKNNEVITDLTIEDWTYGEAANLPSVTLKYGNDTVIYKYFKVIVDSDGEFVDIEVEALDAAPTEAGFYAVKAFAPGTEDYNPWESDPVVFNIGKLSLTKANVVVTGVKDMTYTGKAITQDQMKITVNGEDVVIGEDVTVTYKDNIEVGTATIEIGAAKDSNYTEKHIVTFTIKAATTSPSTGDNSMMPIVVTVSVLGLLGAVIFRKRLTAY